MPSDKEMDDFASLLMPEVLDTMFHHVEDYVVWLDSTCRIRGVSRSLAGLVGITREEALGRNCQAVMRCRNSRGEDICVGPLGCERVMYDARPGPVVSTTVGMLDSGLPLVSSITYPLIVEGRVLGAVRFFRKEIDSMSATPDRHAVITQLSHELRTPLTSIQGYIDLLLSGDIERGSDLEREFLLTVSRSIVHLNEIIGEFLTKGVEDWWKGSETRSQE